MCIIIAMSIFMSAKDNLSSFIAFLWLQTDTWWSLWNIVIACKFRHVLWCLRNHQGWKKAFPNTCTLKAIFALKIMSLGYFFASKSCNLRDKNVCRDVKLRDKTRSHSQNGCTMQRGTLFICNFLPWTTKWLNTWASASCGMTFDRYYLLR